MRIAVSGAGGVERSLRAYGTQLRTWRSLWRTIARDFAAAERQWFSTEGRGTWAPLSEDYAARKARQYPGRPILVAEEDLKAAATSAERLLQSPTASTMSIVIDDPKAAFHGGVERSGPVPRRDPAIPLTMARSIVRKALHAHVRYRRGIPGPRPA